MILRCGDEPGRCRVAKYSGSSRLEPKAPVLPSDDDDARYRFVRFQYPNIESLAGAWR